MVTSYRRLLSHSGVPYLLVVALTVKLSTPVLSLALLLAALDRLGSYTAAGFVLTGHALALAMSAPLGGRLVDRYGRRRVLTVYLAAHAVSYGLLLVAHQAGSAAMVGTAVLLGATTPPVTAVVRGLWPEVVPPDAVQAAYAVDNAVNEVMFIVGPLLVPLLMLRMPASGVVAAAGAFLLVGTAFLLLFPAVRASASARSASASSPQIPGRRLSRLAGPLAHRPTLVLLVLAAFGTFSFGSLRIATVAAATALNSPSAAGVLMGLLSVGALIGALGYGARDWGVPAKLLLIGLSLADSASMLAGAHVSGFLALAVLITAIGLLTGPRDAVHPALLAEHTPARYRTEVFAWLNTFMWTGYGLGTAVAGRLTGPDNNAGPAFLTAAVVSMLAALVAGLAYRPTTRPTTAASTPPDDHDDPDRARANRSG
ncbi:MFS transporter [Nonomuraea bangladeshensis]|uniref:MFS transporter n=1 Tax=Nonomuraea bangladeshensis TaxID=404385 RepID=UPI003C2AB822